jgi:hypothetical protein
VAFRGRCRTSVEVLESGEMVGRVPTTFSVQLIDFSTNKNSDSKEALNYAAAKSGCLWSLLDINGLVSHAANFSLGLSPALDANRTNMSKLNWPNLPRLISDTRACVIPSTFAA